MTPRDGCGARAAVVVWPAAPALRSDPFMDVSEILDEEVDSVARLWALCGLAPSESVARKDLERARRSPAGAVLVGRLQGGGVAASVMVGFDGRRAWADYVAVDPRLRRRGLGRAIVETACGWAKARGAPKLMLMVAEGSEDLTAFYAGLGFERRPVVAMARPLQAGSTDGSTGS